MEHRPLILRTLRAHAARKGDDPFNDRTDDYVVLDGELVVGRIYYGAGARGDLWLWTLSGDVFSYPQGYFGFSGLVDSLDEAKRSLRAAYGRWVDERRASGRPWPPERD